MEALTDGRHKLSDTGTFAVASKGRDGLMNRRGSGELG